MDDEHNHIQAFSSLKNAWPKAVQSPFNGESPLLFNKNGNFTNGNFDGYVNNFNKNPNFTP